MLGRFLIIVLGMLLTTGNVTANSSGLKSLQAEASPDGPPPTITTSYSIDSLSINYYFIPDKHSIH